MHPPLSCFQSGRPDFCKIEIFFYIIFICIKPNFKDINNKDTKENEPR